MLVLVGWEILGSVQILRNHLIGMGVDGLVRVVYIIGPKSQDWSMYSKRGQCEGGQQVRAVGGYGGTWLWVLFCATSLIIYCS